LEHKFIVVAVPKNPQLLAPSLGAFEGPWGSGLVLLHFPASESPLLITQKENEQTSKGNYPPHHKSTSTFETTEICT